MEPVKGGTLASVPCELEEKFKAAEPDMSVSSWAIRFAASHENVMVVLSGMSDMAQLEDNISYMENFTPLSGDEMELMKQAAQIINATIAIPCTGCSYCTVNCPQSVAIPKFFSLYNLDMKELESKDWTPQRNYYANWTKDNSKASDCLKCGECEAMCPQHLPIRNYLEKVAEHFEK